MDNQLALMAMNLGGGLSRYGQNTSSGSPLTELNNQMVQGIATKNAANNQMQFIQMLKEAFNPATTSELKAGPKGLTMSLDPNSEMFKSLQGTEPGEIWEGMAPPLGTPGTQANPTPVVPTPAPTGGTTPNPFVSGQPSFSASDLAGLTPEILANNLSGALNVVGTQQKLRLEREQLKQKSSQELFDMKYKIASLAGDQAYKSKLIENIDSEIEKRTADTNKENVLDQPYPITLPTGELVTHRQWSSLPDKTKQESTFHYLGKKKGMSEVDIANAWKSSDETEKTKFIREALADPKIMAAEKELRKAGATNIGLPAELEKIKAKSALSGQLALDEPKTFTDIYKNADKYVADNLWNKSPQEQAIGRAKKVLSDVELFIVSGGGKFTTSWTGGEPGKGSTKVYTVTWPNGDKKDYSVKLQ